MRSVVGPLRRGDQPHPPRPLGQLALRGRRPDPRAAAGAAPVRPARHEPIRPGGAAPAARASSLDVAARRSSSRPSGGRATTSRAPCSGCWPRPGPSSSGPPSAGSSSGSLRAGWPLDVAPGDHGLVRDRPRRHAAAARVDRARRTSSPVASSSLAHAGVPRPRALAARPGGPRRRCRQRHGGRSPVERPRVARDRATRHTRVRGTGRCWRRCRSTGPARCRPCR